MYMIYEPQEDSFMIRDELIKVIRENKPKSVLDMGTGSGILANCAYENGVDNVVGADINNEAIEFCRRMYPNIEFIQSNLFENINRRFDVITFNPPYLPEEESDKDIALDGGKEGNELILRFIDEADKYMKNNGIILMVFSSRSNPDKIFEKLEKNGYVYEKRDERNYFFERIWVYRIKKKFY